jgi:hypothetical protein
MPKHGKFQLPFGLSLVLLLFWIPKQAFKANSPLGFHPVIAKKHPRPQITLL